MWSVTLSRERLAIFINIISNLSSKSGFVRLLDKLPKGMILNEKKNNMLLSRLLSRMHKHTLFHLLHAETVCCVNWSFQDTTSLTAEQKQQAEHCQSICPFSSAPSALRWCKALIIPVIWISVSRSDPRAQQSQHHYRCGLCSGGQRFLSPGSSLMIFTAASSPVLMFRAWKAKQQSVRAAISSHIYSQSAAACCFQSKYCIVAVVVTGSRNSSIWCWISKTNRTTVKPDSQPGRTLGLDKHSSNKSHVADGFVGEVESKILRYGSSTAKDSQSADPETNNVHFQTPSLPVGDTDTTN